MPDHYFSSQPNAEHDRKLIQATLRGRQLKFITDAGVFSKAGIDFGSRLLIESLALPSDAKVLDMGCGYGPIGISAALLVPDGHVVMADVNERALALARENAGLSGVKNVELIQSDLFHGLTGRSFTHILSNPPIRAGKKVVHGLFEQAVMHLLQGGELWIVIQKKQGAPSAIRKLEELFAEVQVVNKDKGYHIVRAKK